MQSRAMLEHAKRQEQDKDGDEEEMSEENGEESITNVKFPRPYSSLHIKQA